MYISENIKTLRKAGNMTQDEVAEKLGVSPQSVSKWERDETFPDIALLPCIANLFQTSIDALIGMDRINDDNAKTAVFLSGQRLMREGNSDGAEAVYSEALRLFPNDESIALELALVLANSNEVEKLERAMSLCERILSGNASENVHYTSRAALCYIYQKIGEKEKARSAAQILPHRNVCRDTVIAALENEPTNDEINALLSGITFRENPSRDILLVEFGLDMVPIVTMHDVLEKIRELREQAGKNEAGQNVLPAIRMRDNPDLESGQVRIRYYADFLLDKVFDDPKAASDEVMQVLRTLV